MPTTTHSWVKRTLNTALAAACSVVRTPKRLLFTAWTVAVIMVGGAQLAAADTDVLGNQTTPDQFWGLPLTAYRLPPLNLSKAHHGAPYIEEAMWGIFHAIGNMLLFLALAFIRGAITAMQWMLNLTIYQDAAPQIDSAVNSLATSLFWPLLAATVAWAVVTVILKTGGRSVSEALWVLVAGVIAVAFMLSPSQTAGELDQVRTAFTDAAATGYSNAAGGDIPNSAGLPPTPYPAGKEGAVNKLGDSMWNVYGITPWCLASFGPDLTVCQDVGHEFLHDTDRWEQIDASTHERGANEDPSPPCADELKGACDIVRGQDYGQLGVILFLFAVGVALGVLLLVLVIYGVLALVEFLVLLIICPLTLCACMIPGRPRALGVRWGEALIATLLATVVITCLIGGVMVLSGVFNTLIPQWGLFKVALLNVAVFIAAFRVRSQFEQLSGMRSTSSGFGNSYLAFKALSGLTRMSKGLIKGGVKGAAHGGVGVGKGVKAGVAAGMNQIDNPDSAMHKAGDWVGRRVIAPARAYTNVPGRMPGGATTPQYNGRTNAYGDDITAMPGQLGNNVRVADYDRGGHGTPAHTPALSGAGARAALPTGQSVRAALPAGGSHITAVGSGGDRRFEAAGPHNPPTVVDPSGAAHPGPTLTGGHTARDSRTPAPRRAAMVNGAYVITRTPTPNRPKGPTPMSAPQQPVPVTRVVSNAAAPGFTARRRPEGKQQQQSDVRPGRVLPDGRVWIPKA